MLHEELGGAAISPKTVCSAVAEDAPETPAVVGGTRKRKGADHDGVRVIAQDIHKKARAPKRNCRHNKRKAQCKVRCRFRAREQTLSRPFCACLWLPALAPDVPHAALLRGETHRSAEALHFASTTSERLAVR